jgi:eukaryotic-like serine/threonine-protein kinase
MASEPQNPRVFGKYEVIRRLAVGGMGEIFLARQVGMAGFDRLVILKSLLPQLASDADMLTQFLDEARIVGSINHPNVVACYEVGEWEGVYFIAMEYINGVDVAALQQAADDSGLRFPVNVAMSVAREAALGLDSAHHATDALSRALKIVHRDISPHNVMVRQDGLAKIVDFGVAMAANRQKRTEGGLLKGKLGYMAPEQIKGQPLDSRADQFSLGVMLWELLTGRRLFTAEDPHAVFMKIVREVVPPPSSIMADVPPELDAVVLKMTAQEPADRYGRLAEVAAALRKLLDHHGAMEHETQDLVRDLVGAQLAERVRDLTPSPVRILGIRIKEDLQVSTQFCASCGEQAVKGDRFCRACGTPLGGRRTPSSTMLPRLGTPLPSSPGAIALVEDDFTELADDVIDVALDEGGGPTELAVCAGILELSADDGGAVPDEALLRPVWAHLEELAGRFGGSLETSGRTVTATFSGNGRAARGAVAFARRAAGIAARAHRQLRMLAAVGARPEVEAGDEGPGADASRLLVRAHPGGILVTDEARKLSSLAHEWRSVPSVPADEDGPELAVFEVSFPPRFAGRASERVIIEQAIVSADVGRAQQHLLLGEAGTGKSTLLALVDAEARDRGFIIARTRCGAPPGQLRYDGLRQAILSASRELIALHAGGAAGPARSWHEALELLGMDAHDKRRLIALIDDDPPSRGAAPDPAALDADLPLSRRRILTRAAVLGFFSSLAERRGVCLLIDDIHRGDAPSLEVFAEVGARLHTSRLVIFAAGRPMHGERVLPFARRVVLDPLPEKELAQVVSIALGAAVPDEVGEKIASGASGNPLYATLLARHLVENNLLKLERGALRASGDLARYPLPPSLAVLSFARHALLAAEGRQALLAAAQLGAVFTARDAAAALGAEEKAVVGALDACVVAGALVDEGAGAYCFATESEQQVVASRGDASSARPWHLAVAASLESGLKERGRLPVHLEERLALHLAAAGEHERAGRVSERAADAWARLGAAEATREHYRKALQMRWRLLGKAPTADGAGALDVATRYR